MKPIVQLDQRLIDKIAAGEVVERPLSVVKELTENAIDAQATQVTVEITDGGLTAIRVTDNGVGIPAESLGLAFSRHATSKITCAEDLFAVGTLGFRGEALSSIAAVAQVEMVTKTQHALMGTRMEVHGGRFAGSAEVGCANGTTVIVSNLFYNVPARRKFLKKPATEAGYISDCLQKLALGNPSLAIRYIANGQIVFQTNGNGDLRTAVLNVYGREVAGKLMDVDKQSEADLNLTRTNAQSASLLTLNGLLGKPETARGNRSYGTFFINGRYIQSKMLGLAVEAAFRTLLPMGRFPLYVLSLTLPPDALDVNVHPTKMDVRFADEAAVRVFVTQALSETLAAHHLAPVVCLGDARGKTDANDAEIEQIDLREVSATREAQRVATPYTVSDALGNADIAHQASTNSAVSGYTPMTTAPDISTRPALREGEPMLPADYTAQPIPPRSSLSSDSLPSTSPATPLPFFHNYTILGLLFNTYWLLAQGESLYLIDQHAAHERVLYEEIRSAAAAEQVHSQSLIAPMPLRLTPREAATLRENETYFARMGFALEWDDEPALAGVPFLFKGPLPIDFFMEVLDKLAEFPPDGENAYDAKTDLLHQAACKAAVKAGDELTHEESHALIARLLQLDSPFTCPHGRPTIIEITRRELERRFKRG
ncbi:MAG: DNA mismatch repair endonuclease MutL [Defluviitaleaceae bacterium]|nr:DNA mismatch repair endonuclease MutL [Defluviitaleaceae bacterium]